jgi:hypothetical protein
MRIREEARPYFDRANDRVKEAAKPILEFLSAGFLVTWFWPEERNWKAILKPDDLLGRQFGLTKEYFLIGHGFTDDFHQTTLLAEPPDIADLKVRLDRSIRFVASPSAAMEEACAGWANDKRITIVPISEAKALNAIANDASQEELIALLRGSLWRRDWFDDSEPIRVPSEFFGREQYVDAVRAKITDGQPAGIFGLRKIGKSSLLRRIQDVLLANPQRLTLTAFIQCNATKIKAGRWWYALQQLIQEWTKALTDAAQGEPVSVKAGRLTTVIAEGRRLADAGAVAAAFEGDFQAILRAAASLANRKGKESFRIVAFFDEADSVYPHLPQAGYWKDDFFYLWNTLQTIKRGLEDPKQFVYVLGGVNPSGVELGTLLGQPNPLFEMSKLYLGPMPLAEAKSLLVGIGSRMGLSFDQEALALAHGISGGHPWLLRKLGSAVHRTFEDRPAVRTVTKGDVDRVFQRTKREFYSHIDWILGHLKLVAPDEYALLRDIALGGANAYLTDWKDQEFRDVFAEHLHRFGLIRFENDRPVLALGAVADALQKPGAADLKTRKRELRDAVDALEGAVRTRIANDFEVVEEPVETIVTAIPGKANNRPKDREQLRTVGRVGGLRTLVCDLNWEDYLLLLEKFENVVHWVGADGDHAAKIARLRKGVVEIVHIVRHNNDPELEKLIQARGFESLMAELVALRAMLTD